MHAQSQKCIFLSYYKQQQNLHKISGLNALFINDYVKLKKCNFREWERLPDLSESQIMIQRVTS